MIKLLALLGVFTVASVAAQAPTEERNLQGGNSVSQVQQRLGFLIRAREAAQETVKRAELDMTEAKGHEMEGQKRLDAAKKQRLSTATRLDRARQELQAAQRAYQEESIMFERMLKGSSPADARNPAVKK